MNTNAWFTDRMNLHLLIEYMDEKGLLTGIPDILYLIEKPWKYEKEFDAAIDWAKERA